MGRYFENNTVVCQFFVTAGVLKRLGNSKNWIMERLCDAQSLVAGRSWYLVLPFEDSKVPKKFSPKIEASKTFFQIVFLHF